MPIKVRVGQTDAIKILSSAGGGSIQTQNAVKVNGGIASDTPLSVSGISTIGSITPNTLVPLGVLMLLYNVYSTGNLIGGGEQLGGVELMNYVKSIIQK